MHVGIWTDVVRLFTDKFVEGSLYCLENFNVRKYKSTSFRCTNLDKQIWLTPKTKVIPVDIDDGTIIKQEFNFTEYEDIPKIWNNPEHKNQLIG